MALQPVSKANIEICLCCFFKEVVRAINLMTIQLVHSHHQGNLDNS